MPRLIALSTSGSRLDGKRLHFATRQRHLRARCNSALSFTGGSDSTRGLGVAVLTDRPLLMTPSPFAVSVHYDGKVVGEPSRWGA
jgi:hypothetical protein